MILETNKVIKLIYQAYDNETGVLLDSNIEGKPLELIMGKNQLVADLEKEIKGMEKGEEKTVIVSNAYGKVKSEAIKEYPIEQFENIDLKLGMTLASFDSEGNQVYVKVAGFDENSVKIDFNHPLSGKTIKFYVKVLDIRDATDDEIYSGEVYYEGDSCGCGSGCGCK